MSHLMSLPLTIAQQAPPQQSLLGILFPFVLMLGIFYFLVLRPMRTRQRKVQEFQAALKVGDKVITTGGIFGQIVRMDDQQQTVHLQIAEKVKIDVARSAIGGYQGQEPVVSKDGG
jgi:preprotein translocase subunit YajC